MNFYKVVLSFVLMLFITQSFLVIKANTKANNGYLNNKITTKELAKFNGKNGNKSYVAVDGVVYDVSGYKEWKDGEHKMGVMAGKDVTEDFKNKSPHNAKLLNKLPKVGVLVTN